MISAVFDTNIFIQAILSETGPGSACVDELFAGRIVVFVHPEILSEIDDFLRRPRVRKKYRQVRYFRTADLVRKIRKFGTWVPSVKRVFELERDPCDALFIDLAIATNADFLVSRDKDLLDLSADEYLAAKHPKLKIVDPYEFLVAVRETR
ncbi:MAG: putative toxin-antitoxin system toxin component, PIN family [Acidobacteria bacterium]|nr:putative toxin-antitoxin system toxin component, PIN family [Acidobacteriota bacterium]